MVFDWPAGERREISLTVDGIATTPPASGDWVFHGKPGSHRVSAQRKGYHPFDLLVTLADGEQHIISEAWQPKSTILLTWPIEERTGTELRVDGQPAHPMDQHEVDEQRLLVLAVEPGTHMIQVMRDGVRTFEVGGVPSHPDRNTKLDVDPVKPGMGMLVINWPNQNRKGATVTIDGSSTPATQMFTLTSGADGQVTPGTDPIPQRFQLSPGQHRVRLERPGFPTDDRTVQISAGWPPTFIVPSWGAGPHDFPDPQTLVFGPWLDAMAKFQKVDPRDVNWSLRSGELRGKVDHGKQWYQSPARAHGGAYELEVEFTRISGDSVCLIFPAAEHRCNLVLGMAVSGLETVAGHRFDDRDNPYSVRPGAIENHHRYRLRIDVQTNSNTKEARIDIFLDNVPYLQHWNGKDEGLSLAPEWTTPDDASVAFGVIDADVVFHKFRMRPGTGYSFGPSAKH